jgi:hypothetical protein
MPLAQEYWHHAPICPLLTLAYIVVVAHGKMDVLTVEKMNEGCTHETH